MGQSKAAFFYDPGRPRFKTLVAILRTYANEGQLWASIDPMLSGLKASDVGGDASDHKASLWFVVSIEVDFGAPMECQRAVARCTLTWLLPDIGVLTAGLSS